MKYTGVLKTMANFLIISPIFLFLEKNALTNINLLITGTPGFALVGPFFMGLMIKASLRIFRENYDAPLDEYLVKRNKTGYAFTIIGGYTILILRLIVDLLSGALRSIFPLNFANFILAYNEIVVLIIACLAFISVFCALLYPKGGVILFIVTIVNIAIKILIISIGVFRIPLDLLVVILISIDLQKTRKMVKLKQIEQKLIVPDQISSIIT